VNARVIVPDGAPEDEWLEGRAGGVTASEVHGIAHGSRKTWRRILDEKLNGSTWNGNEHTRRGHEWEPRILAEIDELPGVTAVYASSALYGNPENPKHRATPDALGIDEGGTQFGIEVKHHAPGYTQTAIPADHMDQMQWGMHVLGLDSWLYGWAVDGVPGVNTEWVERDEARIAYLVKQADSFIEWRASGAPELDDIPEDVDDDLAVYSREQRAESAAKKAKDAAGARLKAWAAALHDGGPMRRGGTRAALFFEPKPAALVLDEKAWEAAEPETYAEFVAARTALAEQAAAATVLYGVEKPAAPTFRVTPNGAAS
jgi:hypothetical protein